MPTRCLRSGEKRMTGLEQFRRILLNAEQAIERVVNNEYARSYTEFGLLETHIRENATHGTLSSFVSFDNQRQYARFVTRPGPNSEVVLCGLLVDK